LIGEIVSTEQLQHIVSTILSDRFLFSHDREVQLHISKNLIFCAQNAPQKKFVFLSFKSGEISNLMMGTL